MKWLDDLELIGLFATVMVLCCISFAAGVVVMFLAAITPVGQ